MLLNTRDNKITDYIRTCIQVEQRKHLERKTFSGNLLRHCFKI